MVNMLALLPLVALVVSYLQGMPRDTDHGALYPWLC